MLTEGFLAILVIAACAAGIGLGATRVMLYAPANTWSSGPDGDSVEQWEQGFETIRGHGGDVVYVSSKRFEGSGSFEVTAMHAKSQIPAGDLGMSTHLSSSTNPELQIGAFAKDIGRWMPTPQGAFALSREGSALTLTGQLAFNKQYESWSAAGGLGRTVAAFVDGAANFLRAIGIPASLAVALMAVMVASFAATTMDTACRLQRYVIQELAALFLPRTPRVCCKRCAYDLSNLRPSPSKADASNASALSSLSDRGAAASLLCPECGAEHSLAELVTDASAHTSALAAARAQASIFNPFRWLATTHGATLFAVITAALLAAVPAPGQSWSLAGAGKGGLILWPLFGATNQLLAGFAFIVIIAWLRLTRRPIWFAVPPAILMLIVPASAMTWQAFIGNADNASWLASGEWLLVSVAAITLALEAWLIIEMLMRWRNDANTEVARR